MKTRYIRRFFIMTGLFIALIASGLLNTNAGAQGGVRLRQPFTGTYRLTAYIDHQTPLATEDGYMYVYTGERYLDCPGSGEAWTTQGPYCYDTLKVLTMPSQEISLF